MLRPVTATLRPCLCATLRRLCSRKALDANVVTMILWRAAGELTVEAVGDAALRGRKARTLDICRIAQEGKHASLAELTEARQIDHAIFRHGVDFEVAGEDQRADRRFDRKRNSVCNRMVDVDKLHLETACFDGLARLVGEELDLALQMMLLKLELDKPGSEPRAVDGAVELLHGIGNAADVVFMTVGQEPCRGFFPDS